jgi:2-amino-4-hydroxy-6-hydroxymethyldihydropteridine diphosphokinase
VNTTSKPRRGAAPRPGSFSSGTPKIKRPGERVFLGLGSNVGPRRSRLRRAARALADLPGTRVVRASSIYETSPVGPAQADYLNAVVEIATALAPMELLRALKKLERDLGRRPRGRWRPREIDLDILFYGRRRVRAPGLVVPHPRWRERRFVLDPLAEIAPRFRDPLRGGTVARARAKLTAPDQRIKLGSPAIL